MSGSELAFRDLSPSIAFPRNSLKRKNSPFTVYCPRPVVLTVKNFFVILILIFTVKPDVKLLESLRLREFFALQIAWPGDS